MSTEGTNLNLELGEFTLTLGEFTLYFETITLEIGLKGGGLDILNAGSARYTLSFLVYSALSMFWSVLSTCAFFFLKSILDLFPYNKDSVILLNSPIFTDSFTLLLSNLFIRSFSFPIPFFETEKFFAYFSLEFLRTIPHYPFEFKMVNFEFSSFSLSIWVFLLSKTDNFCWDSQSFSLLGFLLSVNCSTNLYCFF